MSKNKVNEGLVDKWYQIIFVSLVDNKKHFKRPY